jgi:hypothetical protein
VIGQEALALARRRSVPRMIPKCAGFIFCEFFSNLGATGCRRGRTPERPLRQPFPGLAIKPDLFFLAHRTPPGHRVRDLRPCAQKVTNWYRKVLRSQEGCLYGGKRLVSVSLSNRRRR